MREGKLQERVAFKFTRSLQDDTNRYLLGRKSLGDVLPSGRQGSQQELHSDAPWGCINTFFIPLSSCNKFPVEGGEARPLPLDAKHKYLLSSLSFS